MATELQFRRGTAAQNAVFTGVEGEVTYSTDEKRLITHDGVTLGGTLQATKAEVDAAASASTLGLALKVAKAGDSMSGTLTISPAANTSALITSGTNTADAPSLNLSQTWNNAGATFNGIKLNITNTASGAASRLIDLLVGGATKFAVDFSGASYAAGTTLDLGLNTNASHTIKFYRPVAGGTNTVDFDAVGGSVGSWLRRYTDAPFQMELASNSGIDLVLDSNNNETGSLFRIYTNAVRGGAQTLLFTVDEVGSVTNVGGIVMPYRATAVTTTFLATDYTVDCTSGTFTLNLPTAVGIVGRIYVAKNSGVGSITLDAAGAELIDGLATATIVSGASLTVQSNNVGWIIL